MEKGTRAAQISDTVEFRHHHLTHPTATPMDRIVHGVTTLTCALHKAPTISCHNQLAAIKALHQAIQRWAKLILHTRTTPQITTLPHKSTRHCSILRPMCRPHEDRPQDVPPRVAIQKPNASLTSTMVASITIQYEPVARRTRFKVSQTVDQPPPRVNRTPDTGLIVRHMHSQTAALASVVTPSQAAQR